MSLSVTGPRFDRDCRPPPRTVSSLRRGRRERRRHAPGSGREPRLAGSGPIRRIVFPVAGMVDRRAAVGARRLFRPMLGRPSTFGGSTGGDTQGLPRLSATVRFGWDAAGARSGDTVRRRLAWPRWSCSMHDRTAGRRGLGVPVRCADALELLSGRQPERRGHFVCGSGSARGLAGSDQVHLVPVR